MSKQKFGPWTLDHIYWLIIGVDATMQILAPNAWNAKHRPRKILGLKHETEKIERALPRLREFYNEAREEIVLLLKEGPHDSKPLPMTKACMGRFMRATERLVAHLDRQGFKRLYSELYGAPGEQFVKDNYSAVAKEVGYKPIEGRWAYEDKRKLEWGIDDMSLIGRLVDDASAHVIRKEIKARIARAAKERGWDEKKIKVKITISGDNVMRGVKVDVIEFPCSVLSHDQWRWMRNPERPAEIPPLIKTWEKEFDYLSRAIKSVEYLYDMTLISPGTGVTVSSLGIVVKPKYTLISRDNDRYKSGKGAICASGEEMKPATSAGPKPTPVPTEPQKPENVIDFVSRQKEKAKTKGKERPIDEPIGELTWRITEPAFHTPIIIFGGDAEITFGITDLDKIPENVRNNIKPHPSFKHGAIAFKNRPPFNEAVARGLVEIPTEGRVKNLADHIVRSELQAGGQPNLDFIVNNPDHWRARVAQRLGEMNIHYDKAFVAEFSDAVKRGLASLFKAREERKAKESIKIEKQLDNGVQITDGFGNVKFIGENYERTREFSTRKRNTEIKRKMQDWIEQTFGKKSGLKVRVVKDIELEISGARGIIDYEHYRLLHREGTYHYRNPKETPEAAATIAAANKILDSYTTTTTYASGYNRPYQSSYTQVYWDYQIKGDDIAAALEGKPQPEWPKPAPGEVHTPRKKATPKPSQKGKSDLRSVRVTSEGKHLSEEDFNKSRKPIRWWIKGPSGWIAVGDTSDPLTMGHHTADAPYDEVLLLSPGRYTLGAGSKRKGTERPVRVEFTVSKEDGKDAGIKVDVGAIQEERKRQTRVKRGTAKPSEITDEERRAIAAKMREAADKWEEKSKEKLYANRHTHTARYLSMARHAESEARRDIADARTMRAIAERIEAGDNSCLLGFTTKKAVVQIKDLMRASWGKYLSEDLDVSPGYDEYRRRKAEPPEPGTLKKHAKRFYPQGIDYKLIRDYLAAAPRQRHAPHLRKVLDSAGKMLPSMEATLYVQKYLKEKGIKGYSDTTIRYINDDINNRKRLLKAGVTPDKLGECLERVAAVSSGRIEDTPEQKLQKKRQEVALMKIGGYFPTPEAEVKEMIERADLEDGFTVYEPSAGSGHIARVVTEMGYKVDVVELNHHLREILTLQGFNVVGENTLTYQGRYCRVLMNPPFERNMDIEHITHVFENNLKPGGRLVAIASAGSVQAGSSLKIRKEFRKFVEEYGYYEDRGQQFTKADVRTGVRTVIIVLDKPGNEC